MSHSAVELRRVAPGDIERLVANLRDQDRAEAAAFGVDPLDGLRHSVEHAKWCVAAWEGDELLCIAGLGESGTVLASVGVPWLLGTSAMATRGRALGRAAQRYIPLMLQAYPVLRNFVHAENTFSVRWLRRLGFEFGPAFAHPTTGAPIMQFEMRA